MKITFGGMEFLTLLAVRRAVEPVSAMDIVRKLAELGVSAYPMAVYTPLARMVESGLLDQVEMSKRVIRGGRTRAAYVLTDAGREKLEDVLRVVDALRG